MPKGMKPRAADSCRIDLAGALSIRDGERLRVTLLEAVQKHSRTEIGFDGVTGADLSAIQLIISARKSAANAGKSLTLTGPAGGCLLDTLKRAGLVNPEGSKPASGQAFWLKQEG
jgi:hypothetical protein